ncbi:MAG: flavin reductase family protein [Rhodobacteraceae bacterium]|nr:flavin reductase family protein [Paracoccaceae bacterium]
MKPGPDSSLTDIQSFVPDPENSARFRSALGTFATGVTVVTARSLTDEPIGITANSFASVSLDPPLVMWCPARASRRFEHFAQARHFAIHVMGAGHKDQALGFVRDGRAFGNHTENANGVPLLDQFLARFECETYAIHEGGDHVIAVGRVARVSLRDGDPLLFSAGDFGRFTSGF